MSELHRPTGTRSAHGPKLRPVLRRGLLIASAVLALVVGVPPAYAGSPLAWSHPVHLDGTVPLDALSCPSPSLCVVGEGGAGPNYQILTSTNPTGGATEWTKATIMGAGAFNAISCPSKSLCVAADSKGNIATSSDPTGGSGAWTLTTGVSPVGFTGLSCTLVHGPPAHVLCVAVDPTGHVITSTDPTGGVSKWHSVDVDGNTALHWVSCRSSSLCVAVDDAGYVVSSSNPEAGTPPGTTASWNFAHVDGSNPMYGVDCPSLSLCVAMDDISGNILTSTDPTGDATKWKLAAAVDTDGFYPPSCPSTTLCVMGTDNSSGNVISSINPTGGASAWTKTHVDGNTEVHPVSCPTTQLCLAADQVGNVLFAKPPSARPDTKITKATIKRKKHRAKFAFRAVGHAKGFQCALVKPKRKHHKTPKARFATCRSPQTYKHLRRGKYTFKVRAFNAAGVDRTPAKRSFKV